MGGKMTEKKRDRASGKDGLVKTTKKTMATIQAVAKRAKRWGLADVAIALTIASDGLGTALGKLDALPPDWAPAKPKASAKTAPLFEHGAKVAWTINGEEEPRTGTVVGSLKGVYMVNPDDGEGQPVILESKVLSPA